ncbi:LapA family protein [Polaribacter sp. Z014]|uniref:lipopolysaccharide assembly protein LapA domain-containing protein n=1 Tax=unclassified Polaribacter TaxID=196858 RepID=UPI00193C39F8|nr:MULTISPECIES: LapA family protein [unclassified Polaribacter]MCL7763656.1 LapA family protein [Polaribacter sp. Z014]QVY65323.1 LapA family protein [Polaribacter sp. Q13]
MKLKNIISFLFIVLIVVFSLQNAATTDVNFLFWKVSISRVLVIIGSFSIGILVGVLMSVKFKRNRTNSF